MTPRFWVYGWYVNPNTFEPGAVIYSRKQFGLVRLLQSRNILVRTDDDWKHHGRDIHGYTAFPYGLKLKFHPDYMDKDQRLHLTRALDYFAHRPWFDFS